MHKTAIVTGAGIVGLAMARALAVRGYDVTVIDQSLKPLGASIRNFGMIWPIGQPDGLLYERALLSRNIWKEVCHEAGIWYEEAGSLHLAYHRDEWEVLQELAEKFKDRKCRLLSPEETLGLSPYAQAQELQGALHSEEELIVDPRTAISGLVNWLEKKHRVRFLWGSTVTGIDYPDLYMDTEVLSADKIFVCSGANFETLYPGLLAGQPLVKCKLQMMRLSPPVPVHRIGPALCGGLSLIHYKSFAAAPSLWILKGRYEKEMEEYIKLGIHVMVSQNQAGELTVGDSHEYGNSPDPFDRQAINTMILEYLAQFSRFNTGSVYETWNGVYAKMTNGETELVLEPEKGVVIVNGLGGAGMTLSFGLAEEITGRL